MLKIRHSTMIICLGVIWFVIGVFLMNMGLNFLANLNSSGPLQELNYPLLNFFSKFLGTEAAILALIILSLVVGLLKGKMIFKKTVEKATARIYNLPEPSPFFQIFPLSYCVLVLVMMGFSFILKFSPNDVRGFIDVAVGSALIQGSVAYFKQFLKGKAKA